MILFAYKNCFCTDNDQCSIAKTPIDSDANDTSQGIILNYLCILCFRIEISDSTIIKSDKEEAKSIDENQMIMKKAIQSGKPT